MYNFYYLNLTMAFKWRIFRVILFMGLILSALTVGGWSFFYIKIRSTYKPNGELVLLFGAFFVFIVTTFFLFWIIKHKYPGGLISNAIQGTTYLASLLIFLASLYLIAWGGVFTNAIMNSSYRSNGFIIFSKYLGIETIALAIAYIYIGVNAFLLVNEIIKNVANTIRQISEIGKV